MRALLASLTLLLTFCFAAPDALGQRKKRRRKKAKKVKIASKQTQVGVEKLMGKFKWGMKPGKILKDLEVKLAKGYKTQIQSERNPLKQDRLRKEMLGAIKKLKKNHVKFTGKRSPWDLSLIDKEYAHKNNESMIVMWGKRDRKFYFFHHDRLWKIYIAFNTAMFRGKTFADFAGAMEARFGTAERKYATTISGESKLDHLAWPPAGKTKLKAIDNTGLYGNFCLVLLDKDEAGNVMDGRKLNSPKKKSGDPLVEAVTKDGDTGTDENEDIVDRITGKKSRAPSTGGGHRPRRPGTVNTTPPKPKKRKKVDTADPLKGLDI